MLAASKRVRTEEPYFFTHSDRVSRDVATMFPPSPPVCFTRPAQKLKSPSPKMRILWAAVYTLTAGYT